MPNLGYSKNITIKEVIKIKESINLFIVFKSLTASNVIKYKD